MVKIIPKFEVDKHMVVRMLNRIYKMYKNIKALIDTLNCQPEDGMLVYPDKYIIKSTGWLLATGGDKKTDLKRSSFPKLLQETNTGIQRCFSY